jgi:hypothetical protein
MTSTVLLKRGKNDGITVYVPEETILKKMTTKIEYVKPEFLYLIRELFDRTSLSMSISNRVGYIGHPFNKPFVLKK